MSEPIPRKQRGRPRGQDTASSSVTTWLRTTEHDRLIQIANREAKSISALIRELVQRKLRPGP